MSSQDNNGSTFTFFAFLSSETLTVFSMLGLLLLAAPILILIIFLDRVCSFIVKHVLVFVTVIVALAAVVGLIGYKFSDAKHKVLGVTASALNVVPGLLVMIFYSIPYVIEKPGIGSWFDFVAALVLMFFVEAVIAGLAMDKENGAKHLLMSIAVIAITAILLNENLTSPKILELYRISKPM